MPNDVNAVDKPIVVARAQGMIDGLQAAARYAAFLITVVTAILGLFSKGDIVGVMNYIQTNLGEIIAAISGLIALGIAAYGTFKTWKRGAQAATVAASSKVPNSVSKIG